MNVFVAGAGGAIGLQLVPQLAERGHAVVALTRTASKAGRLRSLGAQGIVVADAFDRAPVLQAVRSAAPEVVVHQLTALARAKSLRRFDREFALTNRLRTEGLDVLLDAAEAVGARRFVAQSFGNWNYERTGSAPKTEEDQLDPRPPANQRESLRAIRYLEGRVTGARSLEGVALRYGNLYGPGTGFGVGGDLVALVSKRQFPLVGDGAGVWSFVQVEDAAAATVLACEGGTPGVYNVCDDEPLPVAEWLPELARALGAKPPRRLPVWLGRLLLGEVGVSMMTQIRGASNAKARRELGFAPRYPSVREGFRSGLGGRPPDRGATA
jgi:nucleoside-diphosphate-sugar epimerase